RVPAGLGRVRAAVVAVLDPDALELPGRNPDLLRPVGGELRVQPGLVITPLLARLVGEFQFAPGHANGLAEEVLGPEETPAGDRELLGREGLPAPHDPADRDELRPVLPFLDGGHDLD